MKSRFSRMAGPLSRGLKIPDRPKAFTPNTSAFKLLFIVFIFLVSCGPVFAADPEENPFKVLASKFEEKAKPLLEAAEPVPEEKNAGKQKSKKRKKTYVEEVHEERQAFYQKEQSKKTKFLQKLRDRDLTDEERQKKIAQFHAKELERKQKFAEKMNRKVLENTQKEG